MKLTRRHLLAASALVATASVTGVGASWWDQAAGGGYTVLSDDEVEIFEAFAEAVYPAGGEPALGARDAGVSAYLDAVLSGMVETQRDLLRLSLHALDALPVATTGSRLRALPVADATAIIAAWLAFPNAEVRGLVQSFHIFAGMAYLSHPDVAPGIAKHFGCGYGR